MIKKFLSWDKPYVLVLLSSIASTTSVFADSNFEYFGSQIDFWHEKPASQPEAQSVSPPKMPETGSSPDLKGDKAFPWETYLNPKNREFFKEGDYTPPEPFMEIVKNPSDANLKNWFAYLEKKNELTQRLQKRMEEYLNKPGQVIDPQAVSYVKSKIESLPRSAPNATRYRFRLYFDSHCPHCQNMLKTLAELQARGYFVEAKQIDRNPEGARGLSFPVEQATPQEVKEKGIQNVPLLLVGDLEKKAVYRITGYQTVSSILSTLSQAGGETNK